jgi:hypothetical protein
MDLDQLTAPIPLDRARIHPGIQPPPDQLAGNAVEPLDPIAMTVAPQDDLTRGRPIRDAIERSLHRMAEDLRALQEDVFCSGAR